MIKYFCDKCGKELQVFGSELSSDVFKLKLQPPEIRKMSEMTDDENYILCYNCARLFTKWINRKDDFVREAPKPDLETLHIPEACKSCSNHPSNGGSGICHCTLGTPPVKC